MFLFERQAADFASQALAELYLHNHQWEEALGLYLQLRRTDVFDFIERHKLQAACRDKVGHFLHDTSLGQDLRRPSL